MLIEFNETYLQNEINEIEKKFIPNETIKVIIQDITNVCTKSKFKDYEAKIDDLNSAILRNYQEHKKSEDELTSSIDDAYLQITALISKVSYLEKEA